MTDVILAATAGRADPFQRAVEALAASGMGASPAAGAFVLDDPETLWIVKSGRVDVYAIELRGREPIGPRRFLWTAEGPTALFGVRPVAGERTFGLLAAPAGATLIALPMAALRALADRPDAALDAEAVVDAFVSDAASAIASATEWPAASSPTPAAPALDGGAEAIDPTAFDAGLARLRALLAEWMSARSIAIERAERTRLERKAAADRGMREGALTSLASLLATGSDRTPSQSGGEPLLAACRLVGAAADIAFAPPPAWQIERNVRDPLAAICRASRVRSRRVALTGRWWRGEHGPMLGSLEDSGRPVALLPRRWRGYDIVDPTENGRSIAVDETTAASLSPFGVEFYRPSPERRLSLRDLGRMLVHDTRRDLVRLLAAALASGLLGLAMPIATGAVFSEIIPMAVPAYILPLVAALGGLALGAATFDVIRALALVRIQGSMNTRLQGALVDRLLALPVPFFRDYSVGDLAMRTGAINTVREVLAGAAVTTVLTGVFSASNLLLLFYYSPRLAVVALAVVAATLAVEIGLAIANVRIQRRTQDAGGRIAGLLFDMINGIAKLRVAGAEERAFAVWAARFRDHRELAFRSGVVHSVAAVFNGVLPTLAALALFSAAGPEVLRGSIGTGAFLAFNAAFGAFFATTVALGTAAIDLLNLVPAVERAAPILNASLEADAARPDPGELTGRIEVSHVSFRYAADGPLVLEDVSLEARPGEFVAVVGASGSGKSTLLRLLLGFDTPESGAVYLDGQDLAVVDVAGVRAQLGVVLQTSRILAGDLFANIIGSLPLTVDDAWAAAELAGLADDIREMPMGMHTVIPEGGSTLSGGQRQRLLIARALVRRPRILLFDEATSALDNRTQDVVSRSLERMSATRIVIAHRLSTIRNAHRIYVIDRGRVVQHGPYEQLAAEDGLFARLIARQLA